MSISEFLNNPVVQLASNALLGWAMYRLGRTRGMIHMDKEIYALLLRMHHIIQHQLHALNVAEAHLKHLRAKEKARQGD